MGDSQVLSWGAIALSAIAAAIALFKTLAPKILSGWQESQQRKQTHRQQLEMSEWEVSRLEVLQSLGNQSFRDEQMTITQANLQDLVTTMVEAMLDDLKTRSDTHSMQLSGLKKVLYENQEMLRQIQRDLNNRPRPEASKLEDK